MFFDIKCTKCEYKADNMVQNRAKLDEYLKKAKCPECDSLMEHDFASTMQSQKFGGASPSVSSKTDVKINKANARRNKKGLEVEQIKKDPYHGAR